MPQLLLFRMGGGALQALTRSGHPGLLLSFPRRWSAAGVQSLHGERVKQTSGRQELLQVGANKRASGMQDTPRHVSCWLRFRLTLPVLLMSGKGLWGHGHQ